MPYQRPVLWSDIEGHDLTSQQYKEYKDGINSQGAQAFKDANPDFPFSPANADALTEWCKSKNYPMVRANLELAWKELDAAGKLEEAPVEVPDELRGNLHRVDVVTTPVEGRLLEPTAADRKKWADTGSDYQRKKKDNDLKRAAVAERIKNRKTVETVRA
jgi:hypothetical protein